MIWSTSLVPRLGGVDGAGDALGAVQPHAPFRTKISQRPLLRNRPERECVRQETNGSSKVDAGGDETWLEARLMRQLRDNYLNSEWRLMVIFPLPSTSMVPFFATSV